VGHEVVSAVAISGGGAPRIALTVAYLAAVLPCGALIGSVLIANGFRGLEPPPPLASLPLAFLMLAAPHSISFAAATGIGTDLAPSESARSHDVARLKLSDELAYEWDAATRRGWFGAPSGPGDTGTVELPLFSRHDTSVARNYSALAFAAVFLGTPLLFQRLSTLDAALYLAGSLVLFWLMFYMDLATIWSIRPVRLRAIEGTAVLDEAESKEPRVVAIPLFGWRRQLGKLVWARLLSQAERP
jgi:hypothetical protein